MNRLLKFPRPKPAAGKGYILGRVGRETVESDSIERDSDDDLDGIYIDRRPQYDSGEPRTIFFLSSMQKFIQ